MDIGYVSVFSGLGNMINVWRIVETIILPYALCCRFFLVLLKAPGYMLMAPPRSMDDRRSNSYLNRCFPLPAVKKHRKPNFRGIP